MGPKRDAQAGCLLIVAMFLIVVLLAFSAGWAARGW